MRNREHLLDFFVLFEVLDVDDEHFEGLERTAELSLAGNVRVTEDFDV